MSNKNFKVEDKSDKVHVSVNAFLEVKSINDLRKQLESLIGTKDLEVSFNKEIEIDFINLQFLIAMKKWQEEKGRTLFIKNLSLRPDHPVMISGGNILG